MDRKRKVITNSRVDDARAHKKCELKLPQKPALRVSPKADGNAVKQALGPLPLFFFPLPLLTSK